MAYVYNPSPRGTWGRRIPVRSRPAWTTQRGPVPPKKHKEINVLWRTLERLYIAGEELQVQFLKKSKIELCVPRSNYASRYETQKYWKPRIQKDTAALVFIAVTHRKTLEGLGLGIQLKARVWSLASTKKKKEKHKKQFKYSTNGKNKMWYWYIQCSVPQPS